jgi:serine/threonine protein kinase
VNDIDKGLWPRLSPLLDELLDLPDADCAARLDDIRCENATLADALGTLLGRLPQLDAQSFLDAPAIPDPAGLAGQRVGAYTLVRELGHGGMGSVWLARRMDGRYQGEVAIKFLRAGYFGHGDAARFEREGSILARLSHPHIARLLDAGVAGAGTQPYLVLEYIDGEPIDQYCRSRALPTAARVRLFLDVLAAVAHAHNRLILHRDLKPSNILVTNAGEVKLLDFGIAKLLDSAGASGAATELTQRAGNAFTPHYAAPEQLQNGDVTTATDVYALGVLLYMLLGGPHPTTGAQDTTIDRMRAVIEVEPKRLSEAVRRQDRKAGADGPGALAARKLARELEGDVDTIVARALKKAPAHRYANAADFADDLRRWLAHEPIAARPDSSLYRLAKFVRRHRAGVAAGTVAVAAVAVGVGLALAEGREAGRQRVQAEGLIEFMLGDLRRKLQPVGRLDALDAVGEKALAYYRAQDANRLDADSLGRRARALHLIGDLAEQRGRLDEAERDFQRAADTTAELLERHPTDGQRMFDHSQSEYWVGYVQWRRGRLLEADAAMRRYYALAVRMTAAAPANIDWRIEKAFAAQNIAVVDIDLGRYADALKASENADAIVAPVTKARPEVIVEQAHMVGWAAIAQRNLGHYEEALALERRKLALARGAPGGETNRDAQYVIANAHNELSSLLLEMGRLDEADAMVREALARHEALTAVDPGNLDWASEALAVRMRAAEIARLRGRPDEARALHAPDAASLATLLARPLPRRSWRLYDASRCAQLDAALAADAPARLQALQRLQDYRVDVARFLEAGNSLSVSDVASVASALLVLGDLHAREGRTALAREAWEEGLGHFGPRSGADTPEALTLRARLAVRLGRIQDARALAESIGATAYRHPALADLQQRLAGATGGTPAS